MPRTLQQLEMIRVAEMWSEQLDCSQVQLVALEHPQDHGKPPAQPSGSNPYECFVLRHMQRLDGVREHRRKRIRPEQPTLIHLSHVNQQASSERAIPSNQLLEPSNQLRIREPSDVFHAFPQSHRSNHII
ncbi:MAG TPA: hypothetical protein VJR89_23815 [Polyangiales bacterium]|nr:hypothetical protein [Polyangiales bacterium]